MTSVLVLGMYKCKSVCICAHARYCNTLLFSTPAYLLGAVSKLGQLANWLNTDVFKAGMLEGMQQQWCRA